MNRCLVGLVAIVMALSSFVANAEQYLQKDGVTIAVSTLADRVVFCIAASGDLKVSSEYGVEFRADRRNRRLWSETLPKIVTGPSDYFELPLRIELKTRGNARDRRIELKLGACSAAANACLPVTFEVNASSAGLESSEPNCSPGARTH